MCPNALRKMLIKVYHDWSDDKASRLAAALAFYTILSLAPILIIVIAIKMVMEHAALPGHITLAETSSQRYMRKDLDQGSSLMMHYNYARVKSSFHDCKHSTNFK
ncbi:MAG: YihY/virulence factor BrkB family protein [Euryarchaeota archaeon]|nr:YihY/virulence factor BrkB family protein [Euryarchaeota archaeon]